MNAGVGRNKTEVLEKKIADLRLETAVMNFSIMLAENENKRILKENNSLKDVIKILLESKEE